MGKEKNVEVISLLGFFAQIVFAGISYALYSRSGSPAILAQTWFIIAGTLVWLMVLVHGRQRRLARQEQRELEELRQSRLSEEIFEDQELDHMRAHTGLRILERFIAPAFSLIFAGVLAFLCYWNLNRVIAVGSGTPQNALDVIAGMAVVTFFGFLLGKFCVGLSQNPKLRLLRAPGSYMMGNVGGSLLLVIAMSLVHFGMLWPAVVASYLIPAFMGLIGLEIVVNLILDMYRPRVPGQEPRPAYDSRLLNLVAEPGDVLKTVAATLDYQFGFKISETWFYKFMERAIVPLILVQLIALWLLSCVAVVERGEVIFIERFGRPKLSAEASENGLKASTFGPGYHLKLPWPLEKVKRVDADRVYRQEIGKIYYDEEEGAQEQLATETEEISFMADEDVILWSELHVDPAEGKEAQFLVPSTVELEGEFAAPSLNIARLVGKVHYRIKRRKDGSVDPAAVYNYYYRYQEPHRLVKDLAYRILCRIAANQNFLEWINIDREKNARIFAKKLQESLDNRHSGIEILFAGLPSVHPPARVSGKYEEVINAYQEMQTMIHDAEKSAVARKFAAMGRAAEILNEGQAYTYQLTTVAEAERDRFEIQRQAYEKAPRVYRFRKYFTAVEDLLTGHRLYIVPIVEEEVNIIDMQEKLGSDILDIDLEEALQ